MPEFIDPIEENVRTDSLICKFVMPHLAEQVNIFMIYTNQIWCQKASSAQRVKSIWRCAALFKTTTHSRSKKKEKRQTNKHILSRMLPETRIRYFLFLKIKRITIHTSFYLFKKNNSSQTFLVIRRELLAF